MGVSEAVSYGLGPFGPWAPECPTQLHLDILASSVVHGVLILLNLGWLGGQEGVPHLDV